MAVTDNQKETGGMETTRLFEGTCRHYDQKSHGKVSKVTGGIFVYLFNMCVTVQKTVVVPANLIS